jgi:glycosyltransferase involved in cell wall biosynthesis
MDNRPLVSIILTCYNLENYIGDAIKSLLKQDFDKPFELIVIDDGSSDRSAAIIEEIEDDRLKKVFFEVNKGAVEAINYGFSVAKGRYICRFDGDDVWYPDYLKTAAAVLEENQVIGIVHSDASLIDSMGVVTSDRGNVRRPKDLPAKCNEFRYLMNYYYMNAPTMMIRREVWDIALPWKERFRTGMGDWYNSLLMTSKHDSYYIDRPLAYYRLHATNMHRAYLKDRTGEANMAYVLDFFYRNNNGFFTENEWRHLFSIQYKSIGGAYFELSMMSDARRCFRKALAYDRKLILDPSFLRICFASIIGRQRYNKLKSLFGK